jgi:4-amino-4-deoxy-L-arabinose transferase-like glycosyltransferase
VLAHGAWAFAVQALAPIRSPWSRDYGEGAVLAMAQRLAEGKSYFVGLRDYPFLLGNYPPVFIALTALCERAFGPTLWAPRLLALSATLATLSVLYLLLRRVLGERGSALALTVLAVMPAFFTTWASLARVDVMAIFFSLAALAVVAARGVSAAAWPALPLAWLAVFSKQNALVAPAAVLLDLALARDRRLPRVLLAWAGPLAGMVGALVLVTRGAAWRHLVTYTAASDYEWSRMAESYLQLVVIAGPLLATIVAALVAAPRAFAAGLGRLLLVYCVLNLIAFATIAKAGAAQNYFIEPWLAILLLAGFALRALRERFATFRSWAPALLLVSAAVANYSFPSLDRIPAALRRPENARDFKALERLVRETPGPILSENIPVLYVNGRPVLLEPWGIGMLARKGIFRPDRLVADCEAGRFALVVIEYRIPEIPGLGECLDRRYEPLADLGPYQALRPRAPQP